MTSGTGTCIVKYDQAGNTNYNAAPQVTETVNAQKANQTITVTTHAPGERGLRHSFTVAATAASGTRSPLERRRVHRTPARLHDDQRHRQLLVRYDQAGNADYDAAPTVTETVTARRRTRRSRSPRTRRRAPSTTRSSPSRRRRRSGNAVTFSSTGACTNIGRDLHDDQRHRHLHGQVRPGRRRQLQRGAAGDRDGQRGEGRPDDHGHHARAGERGLNTSFTVAATAALRHPVASPAPAPAPTSAPRSR